MTGWPGWVHYRIMWLLGRPSPTRGHARPRRDHRDLGATRLAVVPWPPLAAPGIWGVISGIETWADPGSRCVLTGETPLQLVSPVLPIMDLARGALPLRWSGRDHPGAGLAVEGRDHSQSRSTRQQVSSRTGVPPRRGRPPTQPHGTVVHPTQPPPEGDRVEATGATTREARTTRRAPGDPGRERRAHRQATDHTDPMDQHERPDRQAPDRRRARSELSVAHGCPHDHEHPKLPIMAAKITSSGCTRLPAQP
jgi:hypothetical protein